GGQRRYSEAAIEAALAVRLVFGLPWRQTEGLLGSVLSLMGLELQVPDHTTLSRRTAGLDVGLELRTARGPLHLMVDATGVGLFGEGEWAAAKWGGRGRRGWRKLHVAVDDDGTIVAAELTDNTRADATVFPDLLAQVPAPIRRVTADGAYDRRAVYEVLAERGAQAIIPPSRKAVVSGEGVLADRDAHIEHISHVGRRRWRQDVGQHQQARAENTFYRYKGTFGGRLRARGPAAQRNEVITGCRILNRMA
ncbi:MAG: IS5 family transposase, partial [Actinomycetia bacterium]|nr:IS5 family transposase [Actinomycetes bacterium]